MMILEKNPRLGGAVDLGQLERLRELKDSRVDAFHIGYVYNTYRYVNMVWNICILSGLSCY